MDSSLVKDNPLLLPLNAERTVYDGFVTVQERDFRLRILLPPDRQLKRAKLQCCWLLKHLLRGYEHIVKQRLQQSADLVTFLLELKTVLEVGLKSRPECSSIPPPQYYSQLIAEMETLGWNKLLFIDTELRTLRLKAEDSSGRQHILTIKLKSKHPAEAPECSADLPLPLATTWTPQSTLQQLHDQFLVVLESLTEFWDVLEEVDGNTWILEPEKPSRSDTMRRIAIGNNVSIKVEVDPRHPKMLPECCLLGAEHDLRSVSTSARLVVLIVVCRRVTGLASRNVPHFHSRRADRPSFAFLFKSPSIVGHCFCKLKVARLRSLLPSNATQNILNTYTPQPRWQAGGDPQIRGVAQKYCFLHVGITSSEGDEYRDKVPLRNRASSDGPYRTLVTAQAEVKNSV
ncbi:E3 ubiquitin-protein ligase FANCL isoform X1 [Scophthalmus maximus]|uniref:E3 ubiquitin-protein ligase FANCL isoform X1 n=1 Tax=Scophthalmus maximus TaxID=52904 RepID=UPI0015E1154A|nr:E3 ubiquitin-protein ligase FANCL isoform X1 [Scophthalmus maximus]